MVSDGSAERGEVDMVIEDISGFGDLVLQGHRRNRERKLLIVILSCEAWLRKMLSIREAVVATRIGEVLRGARLTWL